MNKPNLVFIIAEQLNYSALGFNRNPLAITPAIDKIAKESVIMENCIVNHPVDAPYQASLFTGKLSIANGVINNCIKMNNDQITLPWILSVNKYATSFIGRWYLNGNSEKTPVTANTARMGFNDEFIKFNYDTESSYFADDGTKKIVSGFSNDVKTDLAINNIRKNCKKNQPFATFLTLNMPFKHLGFNIPDDYYSIFKDVVFPKSPNYMNSPDELVDKESKLTNKDKRKLLEYSRRYYALVRSIDTSVGRIYDTLNALGVLDNTVFVFTSSGGECLGNHGRLNKNIFYSEACHVPFILRYPSCSKPKRVSNNFSTIDIMPTLMNILGIQQTDNINGTDIARAIKYDDAIYNPCLLLGMGHSYGYGNGYEWRAIRDEQFTYGKWRDGKHFLFDNVNDTYQLNNIFHTNSLRHIRQELRQRLNDTMIRCNDNFNSASYYRFHK